jgi:hypothetical protein
LVLLDWKDYYLDELSKHKMRNRVGSVEMYRLAPFLADERMTVASRGK